MTAVAAVAPEYVIALETDKPARFKPADMEHLKQHLAVLIREHVRAVYHSQGQAAVALGTTQPTISRIATGQLDTVKADFLLGLAMKVGLIRKIEVRVE